MKFKSLKTGLVGIALTFCGGIASAQAGLVYTAYTGSANGVTVRDADTLAQITYFDPGFVVNGIAAGTQNDMYLTGGNSIAHYSNTGTLLNSFSWGNNTIEYTSATVGDGKVFISYQGGQEGITVRDVATLVQSNAFSTSLNNGIGSASENIVYRVAGNNITRYDENGAVLSSFDFPNPDINYTNIDLGLGELYASYAGPQNGVTVRDALTLAQTSFFSLDFLVNGLAAGGNNDMYLTNANSIYHYRDDGSLLNQMTFPNQGIIYTDIAYAADVPEPGPLALLGLGLLGLSLSRKRRA